MSIPLVDFAGYFSGNPNEKLEVSKKLVSVVSEYGFVYLKNFGISNDLINQMFDLSKQFFSKPLEYKRSVQKSHDTFTGYDGMCEEKLTIERPGDLKESYMIKKNVPHWPSEWPEFQEFISLFHSKCYDTALDILRAFAIGLDVDIHLFDNNFDNGEVTLLRLLHYPPLPDQIEENQIRCGEHTDYGALTLLFQDSIGGLEVKGKNGEWIHVDYIPNTILVNVGDVMEIWTNGYLKSTLHRVVNPNEDKISKSRYSTAFFCDPDLNREIKCLDQFVNDKNPAKYPTKSYKEHLFGIYNQTYAVLQDSNGNQL